MNQEDINQLNRSTSIEIEDKMSPDKEKLRT
jgi:hypothetical protein